MKRGVPHGAPLLRLACCKPSPGFRGELVAVRLVRKLIVGLVRLIRLDDLKSQVDAVPTSDDVSKLDNRIKDVEKKADSTGSDIDKLNGRVDDLEKRVDDVEQAQETQTNTTTTP